MQTCVKLSPVINVVVLLYFCTELQALAHWPGQGSLSFRIYMFCIDVWIGTRKGDEILKPQYCVLSKTEIFLIKSRDDNAKCALRSVPRGSPVLLCACSMAAKETTSSSVQRVRWRRDRRGSSSSPLGGGGGSGGGSDGGSGGGGGNQARGGATPASFLPPPSLICSFWNYFLRAVIFCRIFQ